MGVEPLKDPDTAHPIPEAWRPVLGRIVEALTQGDYELSTPLASVAPLSPSTSEQIREYLADYGATLIDLPDETWQTSVCEWMGPPRGSVDSRIRKK